MSSSSTRPSECTPLLNDQQDRRDHGSTRSNGDEQNAASSQAGPTDMPPRSVYIPILTSIWTAVFISSLDSTIVATLVGSIGSSFGASEQSSWIGASYLLSLCCFNPLMGRLSDVFGRRGVLLSCLCLFTLGTAGCGIAPSLEWFLVARVVAGAGGGGLTTTSNIIMTDLFPLRSRGLIQGLTNIVFGAGSGLGGPVGGFINDLLGWRKAFILQVPLLAIAFTLSILYVRDGRDPNSAQLCLPFKAKLGRVDFLGSFTLVTTVACILVPLSLLSGADAQLSDPWVWGTAIAGLVGLAAFVLTEIYVAAEPILPMRLLRSPTVQGVCVTNFTLSISGFATLYTYPLFFQAVRLQSASQAGLHIIPYSVALSLSSVMAGAYMRATGRYKKYCVANTLFQVLSSCLLFTLSPSSPEWLTYVAIFPLGLGGAGILVSTLIAIINCVPRTEMAVATALTYLFRTSGQVLGVGLGGTLLQFSLRDELAKRIGDPDLVRRIRHSSDLISHLEPALQHEASEAYLVATRRVWGFLVVTSLLTFAGSLLMEDRELPGQKEVTEGEGESREGGSEDEGNVPPRMRA